MRIVLISDTHEQHEQIKLPEGDVLIHAGDLTMNGSAEARYKFYDWFHQLPYRYKIYIAGNHDFGSPKQSNCNIDGIFYLRDEGCKIEGMKFWGSPATQKPHPDSEWMFGYPRGGTGRWEAIPKGVDVLVTHGPPMEILDAVAPGAEHLGCPDLLQRVLKIEPKVHVFGHIHGGYGQRRIGGTLFANAASCTEQYKPLNPPMMVDL